MAEVLAQRKGVSRASPMLERVIIAAASAIASALATLGFFRWRARGARRVCPLPCRTAKASLSQQVNSAELDKCGFSKLMTGNVSQPSFPIEASGIKPL